MSMISSPCRRCWRPTGSAPEGGLASDSPVGGWGSPRSGGDNDKRRGYTPSTTRHPLHNTPSPPLRAGGEVRTSPFKRASTLRHPFQARKHAQAPTSSAQARSGTHFKRASPLRHPLRARKHAQAPISSAQARSRPCPAPRNCSGEASNPRSQR